MGQFRVTLNPGNQTMNVYVDDAVLTLLPTHFYPETEPEQEEFIISILRRLLASEKYKKFNPANEDIYLGRIHEIESIEIEENDGVLVDVLVGTATKGLKSVTINLTDPIDIQSNTTPAIERCKLTEPFKPWDKVIETNKIYLETCTSIREGKIKDFVNARRMVIVPPPKPFTMPSTRSLHSVDFPAEKIIEQFAEATEALHRVQEKHDAFERYAEALSSRRKAINAKISALNSDKTLHAYRIKLMALSNRVKEAEKEIPITLETYKSLKNNFPMKIKHSFVYCQQALIDLHFIKERLAWALYNAALSCFNRLQQESRNNPALRAEKIAHFNEAFKDIAYFNVKTTSMSRCEYALNFFKRLSLEQIAERINLLLAKYNTSVVEKSAQQLVIEDAIKDADSAYRLHFLNDYFSMSITGKLTLSLIWDWRMKDWVDELETEISTAQQEVREKSEELKTTIAVQELDLGAIDQEFNQIVRQIENHQNHQRFLVLKDRLAAIKQLTAPTILELTTIKHIFTTIESLDQLDETDSTRHYERLEQTIKELLEAISNTGKDIILKNKARMLKQRALETRDAIFEKRRLLKTCDDIFEKQRSMAQKIAQNGHDFGSGKYLPESPYNDADQAKPLAIDAKASPTKPPRTHIGLDKNIDVIRRTKNNRGKAPKPPTPSPVTMTPTFTGDLDLIDSTLAFIETQLKTSEQLTALNKSIVEEHFETLSLKVGEMDRAATRIDDWLKVHEPLADRSKSDLELLRSYLRIYQAVDIANEKLEIYASASENKRLIIDILNQLKEKSKAIPKDKMDIVPTKLAALEKQIEDLNTDEIFRACNDVILHVTSMKLDANKSERDKQVAAIIGIPGEPKSAPKPLLDYVYDAVLNYQKILTNIKFDSLELDKVIDEALSSLPKPSQTQELAIAPELSPPPTSTWIPSTRELEAALGYPGDNHDNGSTTTPPSQPITSHRQPSPPSGLDPASEDTSDANRESPILRRSAATTPSGSSTSSIKSILTNSTENTPAPTIVPPPKAEEKPGFIARFLATCFGIGSLTLGVSLLGVGTCAGAAVGALFAPATLGISILAGGLIGAAVGVAIGLTMDVVAYFKRKRDDKKRLATNDSELEAALEESDVVPGATRKNEHEPTIQVIQGPEKPHLRDVLEAGKHALQQPQLNNHEKIELAKRYNRLSLWAADRTVSPEDLKTDLILFKKDLDTYKNNTNTSEPPKSATPGIT